MHCSREGHDRVEMQLLNEDLGSGRQILRCPECGWEAKIYGPVAATSVAPAPKPAKTPPRRPSKGTAPRTQCTSVKSIRILTVVMFIAVIGGMIHFARDAPIPGYGVDDSDVTGGDDFGVATRAEDLEMVDGSTSAAALFERACNDGDGYGCSILATMYNKGTGVAKATSRAAKPTQ